MSFLKDYFYFSRAERFGIFGLCGLLLLALIIKLSMPYWMSAKNYDTSAFAEEIKQFRLAVSANTQTESHIYVQNEIELFYFDPNRASDEDWEKLGLNGRQIRNIRNYQASGGNFRRKEDLQKLYSISSTQFRQLEPYIRIAANQVTVGQISTEKTKKIETKTTVTPQKTKLTVELNTADSSLLTQLPGVGTVLATRTLKYRNLIGGFANVEQLSEVYGINRELIERLADQLTIDSSQIRKIPVNKATLNELAKHPYINEQQARGILTFRRLQKRIDNIDELTRNNILEPETAEKIKPYLSFD